MTRIMYSSEMIMPQVGGNKNIRNGHRGVQVSKRPGLEIRSIIHLAPAVLVVTIDFRCHISFVSDFDHSAEASKLLTGVQRVVGIVQTGPAQLETPCSRDSKFGEIPLLAYQGRCLIPMPIPTPCIVGRMRLTMLNYLHVYATGYVLRRGKCMPREASWRGEEPAREHHGRTPRDHPV